MHEELSKEHTLEGISKRLSTKRRNYLGDFLLGSIDGTITTFAIVSGVAGASFSIEIALILGVANLLADGFSMGVSNYFRVKTEHDILDQVKKKENHHIDHIPEGERLEIETIFKRKGFEGKDLKKLVELITSKRSVWVETMLREEYHLDVNPPRPLSAGGMTFAGFVIAGAIPLAPLVYFQSMDNGFIYSALGSAATFFAIGSIKGKILGQTILWEGIKTFFIGVCAAGIAYSIGYAAHLLAS